MNEAGVFETFYLQYVDKTVSL